MKRVEPSEHVEHGQACFGGEIRLSRTKQEVCGSWKYGTQKLEEIVTWTVTYNETSEILDGSVRVFVCVYM